jgi:imidazolonepropionase
MSRLLIKNAKALLGTHLSGVSSLRGAAIAQLPRIEDGWLLAENGIITALGPMSTWPGITDWNDLEVLDATDRYVLPGWCDSHTHAVFAAPREEEFVMKLRGATYQEIAAAGGGILNSARKLRAMSEDELYLLAKDRLEGMMRTGTVAVEIKSGYGLSLQSELKMLRVVKRLKESLPLQVKATLLAAHALPEEFKENRKGYVDLIVDELLPQVAAEGLANHVDVFCETNYFTVEEMRRIMNAGSQRGLRAKVHVNQFTSIGGVQAAVEANALSVDHLEEMTDADGCLRHHRHVASRLLLLPSYSLRSCPALDRSGLHHQPRVRLQSGQLAQQRHELRDGSWVHPATTVAGRSHQRLHAERRRSVGTER